MFKSVQAVAEPSHFNMLEPPSDAIINISLDTANVTSPPDHVPEGVMEVNVFVPASFLYILFATLPLFTHTIKSEFPVKRR